MASILDLNDHRFLDLSDTDLRREMAEMKCKVVESNGFPDALHVRATYVPIINAIGRELVRRSALATASVFVFLMQLGFAASSPADLQGVMDETHKRVIVEHSDWYARDFRYIPAGEEVWGNCATFATTASVLAMAHGHSAEVKACGTSHVFAEVDGKWDLDARYTEPKEAGTVTCP